MAIDIRLEHVPLTVVVADFFAIDADRKKTLENVNLFFPSAAERPQARERREAAARDVCAGCQVNEHRAYGIDLEVPDGEFAGEMLYKLSDALYLLTFSPEYQIKK